MAPNSNSNDELSNIEGELVRHGDDIREEVETIKSTRKTEENLEADIVKVKLVSSMEKRLKEDSDRVKKTIEGDHQ